MGPHHGRLGLLDDDLDASLENVFHGDAHVGHDEIAEAHLDVIRVAERAGDPASMYGGAEEDVERTWRSRQDHSPWQELEEIPEQAVEPLLCCVRTGL